MVDRGWLEEDRMKKSWKSSNASRVRKLSSLCRQSSSHVYYQKTPSFIYPSKTSFIHLYWRHLNSKQRIAWKYEKVLLNLVWRKIASFLKKGWGDGDLFILRSA